MRCALVPILMLVGCIPNPIDGLNTPADPDPASTDTVTPPDPATTSQDTATTTVPAVGERLDPLTLVSHELLLDVFRVELSATDDGFLTGITGTAQDLMFGQDTLAQTTLAGPSGGGSATYWADYTGDAALLQASMLSHEPEPDSESYAQIWQTEARPDGSALVLVSYAGTIGIGDTVLTSPVEHACRTVEVALVELSAEGVPTVLWTIEGQGGTLGLLWPQMVVHADDSITVSGQFDGGAVLPDGTALDDDAGIAFIARLDGDGDVLWHHQWFEQLNISPYGDDDLLVHFGHYDGFEVDGFVVDATSSYGGAFGRMDSSGTYRWLHPVTGEIYTSEWRAPVELASGDIAVGVLSQTPELATLATTLVGDAHVVVLDPDGDLRWSTSFETGPGTQINGIVQDAMGTVWVSTMVCGLTPFTFAPALQPPVSSSTCFGAERNQRHFLLGLNEALGGLDFAELAVEGAYDVYDMKALTDGRLAVAYRLRWHTYPESTEAIVHPNGAAPLTLPVSDNSSTDHSAVVIWE